MRVRKTTEREFYSALYQVVKQIKEMVKRNYELYQGDPNRLIMDLMAYAHTLEPTAPPQQGLGKIIALYRAGEKCCLFAIPRGNSFQPF